MTVEKKSWDQENMVTLACRVRKEEAEKFRAVTQKMGLSAHAVLKAYVDSVVDGTAGNSSITEEMLLKAQMERDMLRAEIQELRRRIEASTQRARNAEMLVDRWLSSDPEYRRK